MQPMQFKRRWLPWLWKDQQSWHFHFIAARRHRQLKWHAFSRDAQRVKRRSCARLTLKGFTLHAHVGLRVSL